VEFSTLVTDPEFQAILNRFILGDVFFHGSFDNNQR
jgi:hypothetical protein